MAKYTVSTLATEMHDNQDSVTALLETMQAEIAALTNWCGVLSAELEAAVNAPPKRPVTNNQFGFLFNHGFNREQINAMDFDTASAHIDRLRAEEPKVPVTAVGIKCGNCKGHHATAEQVKECFLGQLAEAAA